MAADVRLSGVLSSWDETRGFGFISSLATTDRVFVHISAFLPGSRRPAVGDALSFSIETSNGKSRAAGVTSSRPVRFVEQGQGDPLWRGRVGGAEVDAARDRPTRNRPAPARPASRRPDGGSRHPVSRSWAQPASFLAVAAFLVLAVVLAHAWRLPGWVLALYVAVSVITFVVYAIDKRAAVKRRWRVSENTLWLLGLLCGWPGAILAQQLLSHKTRKRSFQIVFWITVALNVAAFVGLARP